MRTYKSAKLIKLVTSCLPSKCIELAKWTNLNAWNSQGYGSAMFFVVVKTVHYYTCTGCSDIKETPKTTKLYQFKHENPKAKLHITEQIHDISIT